MIFAGGNPFLATKSIIGDYFFVQLTDSYNAGVIVLIVFIGGFIKLMEKSGGAQAFSRSVYKYVNTSLKAQLCAWLGGILIFFSDLGTPLLVGPVFRPLFDKLKISREKLAWILDSTSSPVAIIMIPLAAFTKKDFSQMKKAEAEAASREDSFEELPQHTGEEGNHYSASNARPVMVIVPILVVFATLFLTLAPLGFPFQKIDGNEFRVALTMGYFYGTLALMMFILIFKVKTFRDTFKIYVISGLGTADFIVNGLKNMNFYGGLVPGAIFIFGAFVSFSTGSSWGTFAIMMPLAIPMADAFGIPYAIAVGAVLSGGLFGDHCSPISDTTILSSTGAQCDLVAHVKTQLPYACVNGAIAFTAFLFAGFTKSPLAVVLAAALLFTVMMVWGKKSK